MPASADQMMEEYDTLSLKMGLMHQHKLKVFLTWNTQWDVEVLLGLSHVFLLLEALHNHIKFNQMLDVLCVSLL